MGELRLSNQKQADKGSRFFAAAPVQLEGVRIELLGNRRAVIEGCTGILEYEKEKISIKTCASMKVCFTGRNLHVCCMDRESLVVEGFILSLSYGQ